MPGEPIGQGRPRAIYKPGLGVRMYTPKKSDSWCGRAIEVFASHWDGGPSDQAFELEVRAVFARPKRLMRKSDPEGRVPHLGRPDVDNVAKAVMDALTKAGVIRDDAQVCGLHATKAYAGKSEGPCVEVTMRAVDGARVSPRKVRELRPVQETLVLQTPAPAAPALPEVDF